MYVTFQEYGIRMWLLFTSKLIYYWHNYDHRSSVLAIYICYSYESHMDEANNDTIGVGPSIWQIIWRDQLIFYRSGYASIYIPRSHSLYSLVSLLVV